MRKYFLFTVNWKIGLAVARRNKEKHRERDREEGRPILLHLHNYNADHSVSKLWTEREREMNKTNRLI